MLSSENWDHILCLGDLVYYGPSPEEVINRMNREDVMTVRGSHDNAVALGVDCGCGYEIKELSKKTRKYTKEVISQESTRFLKDLPMNNTYQDFFMTHATPEGLFDYIKPDTHEDKFSIFSNVDKKKVLLDHTHLPMDKCVKGKRYINPGRVGQPRDGG